MNPLRPRLSCALSLSLPVPLIWLACALPAAAQYKVVAPDGRVTYTDRPPAAASAAGTVQPLRVGRAAPAAAPGAAALAAGLPLELRNLVGRFPVTLYTGADCTPCADARQLLQARGVPYSERTVSSNDDISALQRLSGGRSLPTLMVGSQALRGLAAGDWQDTLDLAGYPRDSRLPRGWAPPPPAPLVARQEPTAALAPAPAPAAAAPPPATPAPSGGIRF